MHKLVTFSTVAVMILFSVVLKAHPDHHQAQSDKKLGQQISEADPQQLISQHLQTLWPSTRVGAVSIADNFALANWWLHDKAGRALLQQDLETGQWQVILCGGDALLDASFLAEVGVNSANALAKKHLTAEVGLSQGEKVALGSMLKPVRFEQHSQQAH